MATVERRNRRCESDRASRPTRSAPLGPQTGAGLARAGSSVDAALGTASGTAGRRAARKPLQLDELQAQRLDPGDEAVQHLLGARIEAGTAVAAFAVDLARRTAGRRSRPPVVQAAALTEREQLVLRYVASTLSNAEIASELCLSVNTVKSHQRMVCRSSEPTAGAARCGAGRSCVSSDGAVHAAFILGA
jgi:LuxR family maltose regulon positive regulatory protein